MIQINTPILLIGFNRPDTMQIVFDEVRKAQPKKLYYAVDCARIGKSGEDERVSQVRAIIQTIDWPCDVHTLFQTKNRGCGFGPAEAISWAFEQEDRLIVLEDDCVPSQSFFRFCDEMLERFNNDTRVNIISGRSHHQGTKFFENQDYIFTHYAHTWGWATWKRAWDLFDIKMEDFPSFVRNGGTSNVFLNKKEAKYWSHVFSHTYSQIEIEVTHSWDMQWVYARLKEGGLGIVPAYNLITNIGMGNGTHTPTCLKDIPVYEMVWPIRHPLYVVLNKEYEEMHYHSHINVKKPFWRRLVNWKNR